MNVLEKILEEIDKTEEEYYYEVHSPMFCMGGCSMAADVKDIIRSHMGEVENDGWISVSKRLPEPDKIVYVTVHCSEWISDYDSDWVTEDEKVHHREEYIVNVGYVDEDGHWIVFNGEGCEVCCDKKFGTDQGCAYSVVTAWKSLPEPYKGE